ncbi:MAG TPA: glycosyltransferase family 9 protein [Ohtaekwangia sp.]|nr:glycosyltransferase family 9 protein [Ohtaekwangia sp.]
MASDFRNILCVRLDNMGDVVMSSPAMEALKETFNCRITVLTSTMAQGVIPFLSFVDDVIVFDAPWVKSNHAGDLAAIINTLHERQFDAAFLFTVFSQNPLPAAMLCAMAGIPRRIAYCRENPYALLTDWLPEAEPYAFIRHQVQRDLDLVMSVGAIGAGNRLKLTVPAADSALAEKLNARQVAIDDRFLILHPGVSERKREFPKESWIEVGKNLRERGYPLLVTGSAAEAALAADIANGIGERCKCLAGILSLTEFLQLIRRARLVISVNTATIHFAAALETPVIVLYAMTNPQHTPWRGTGRVLPFDVPESMQSRNEVIRYVNGLYGAGSFRLCPVDIVQAADEILDGEATLIPDDLLIPHTKKTLNLIAP